MRQGILAIKQNSQREITGAIVPASNYAEVRKKTEAFLGKINGFAVQAISVDAFNKVTIGTSVSSEANIILNQEINSGEFSRQTGLI